MAPWSWPGKAANNGPSPRASVHTWETQRNFLAPGFELAQLRPLWHLGSEPSVGSSLSLLLKCTKDNFLLWPPFKAIQEILAVCLHSDIFLYSWQKQDFMYMKRVLRFVSTPWWSISAEIFALSQCLLLSQILESQLCRPCHYLCMGYFFSLCVYIGGSFESLFFQLMNDLVDRTMGSTV